MGASGGLSDLRIRHREVAGRGRPFFIDEASWAIFSAFVIDGRSPHEIAADRSLSVRRVRNVLADVDHRMSLPRGSKREWTELTAASPIEDLALSVRACNRLRDLGCRIVEDVLRLDLGHAQLGRRSRKEVTQALRRWNFQVKPENEAANDDLERVSSQLRSLREKIDQSTRLWRHRVAGLEARLERLRKAE
jgi:hypothetical protein